MLGKQALLACMAYVDLGSPVYQDGKNAGTFTAYIHEKTHHRGEKTTPSQPPATPPAMTGIRKYRPSRTASDTPQGAALLRRIET